MEMTLLYSFFNIALSRPLFAYFLPFHITIHLQIEKRGDVVQRILTGGH